MTHKFRTLLLALGLATLSFATFAQATLPTVEGEVRKIDAEHQKITLRHGEIPNIDMGAMTMVFRAREPAMLNSVAVGDKVRFTAERVDGALTVMTLEKSTP